MSDQRKRPEGVTDFEGAAGGWPALKSATRHLREQQIVFKGNRTLLSMNKPDGFDCPGCAWPDANPHGSFEYCENGAKAIAWEATEKRATPELFAEHDLDALRAKSDHWLEDQGRLIEPMRFDHNSKRYVAASWQDAFDDIGRHLSSLDDPNQAEFYTSGRTSNEAAFLLQLFVRLLGTNNFPDCSNLCHEASSVGLPRSIGVGKGTVTLDDFSRCKAIFSFGHNPATNHPRMLGVLRDAAQRGVPIVVFNPLRERGLQRFRDPQRVPDMLAGQSTFLATHYYQLQVGGDIAAINGVCKALLERENGVDLDFIQAETNGLDALASSLRAMAWSDVEAGSGLTQAELEEAADIYAASEATIIAYGMGITQHRHGTDNVRALANLALLGGNIGKPGAGICPVRGHSNVQGDRTMGIWEKPSEAFLDRLEAAIGVPIPREHGHSVVDSVAAMNDGSAKAFVGLGGNLVAACSDPKEVARGLEQQRLTAWISTKLNRSHLAPGQSAWILPCLGRTEQDLQSGGMQAVTVEDSMSMVHASRGVNAPASPSLKSECAIVAGIAEATLTDSPVDWQWLVADYDRIRDLIEKSIAGFERFNERIKQPGGFHLPNAARERRWLTPSGKAELTVIEAPAESDSGPTTLKMTTIRSHDQYNTTIYGYDDRYRGISGRRDVLFMNSDDLERLNLNEGDEVTVTNAASPTHKVSGFTLVDYDVPVGCCAAYFPEANPIIPLAAHDGDSGTPGYKSVDVSVVPLQRSRK